MKRLFLLLILCCCTVVCMAQQFSVSVVTPEEWTGRASLSIHDGTKNLPQYSARIQEGKCTIEGELMQNHPYYAELKVPQIKTAVEFFIESSHITIRLNKKDPSDAKISGSKSNSEYRYILETCNGDNREASLTSYVKSNPGSFFSPTILFLHLKSIPLEEYKALTESLVDSARTSYHYKQARQQLSLMAATSEGYRLPDFEFPNKEGRATHFDQIQHDSTLILLAFGATWCKQCQDGVRQIRTTLKSYGQPVRVEEIPIDKNVKIWDAPYMQQLGIEHIPFYILVDEEGRTLARDFRPWELQKILPEAKPQKQTETKTNQKQTETKAPQKESTKTKDKDLPH